MIQTPNRTPLTSSPSKLLQSCPVKATQVNSARNCGSILSVCVYYVWIIVRSHGLLGMRCVLPKKHLRMLSGCPTSQKKGKERVSRLVEELEASVTYWMLRK